MHILSTTRLSLDVMSPEDAPFYLDLINQPSFIANIRDKGIRTLEGAAEDIRDGALTSQREHGFSLFRVSLRASGEAIGMCGLVRRDTLPEVDIGYAFLPQFWGQGYAWEAASAVRDYARQTVGLKRLMGITSPDNLASLKLLQKLGMEIIEANGIHNEKATTILVMDL
ncbi:MAG: GNAT family N-acetyltransferase [Burkholderiales bacterium]|nr:GNAT family N-acetyltransferase [Burkholderiales bacterium]